MYKPLKGNNKTNASYKIEDNPYIPTQTTRASSTLQISKPPKLGPIQSFQPTIDPAAIIEKRHELFQEMLADLKELPLQTSVEKSLLKLLNADQCIFWISNQGISILTTPTYGKSIKPSTGIIGACFRLRRIINVYNPAKHDNFNQNVDFANMPSLYLPFFKNGNNYLF